MPEFGEALLRECVRDWKAYYINYNRLKGWIKEMQEGSFKEAYAVFFEELETNLTRVDSFFQAQEAQLEQAIKDLCQAPSPSNTIEDGSMPADRQKDTANKEAEMAKCVLDSIEKLRCFAQMNFDGFRKITKKFDKKVGCGSELPAGLQARMLEVVKTYHFAEYEHRLNRLLAAVEDWKEGREAVLAPPPVKKMLSRLSIGMPLLEKEELGQPNGTAAGKLREFLRECLNWLGQNAVLLVLSLGVVVLASADLSPKLNRQSYLVIWVTTVVLTSLTQQVAADSVLAAATLVLAVSGVLTNKEAWQAFSNEVVLSVAGLGVIASAVGETGVIDLVFKVILGKPKSLPIAMLRLMLPAMVLNLGISNTCVMSCLLPVIDTWSQDLGMHKAFFLAPLSYLLLISGTFAIFSTSTNLVAQGLLISHDLTPFQNFDLAIPATASSLVTIVYLVIFTPIVLRRFWEEVSDWNEEFSTTVAQRNRNQNRYDVRVQLAGRHLDGQTLESSGILGLLPSGMGDVFSCERYGAHVPDLSEDMMLKLDDILWLRVSVEGIINMFYAPGMQFLALDLSEDYATLDPSSRQLVEAVLDKECPLIAHRIGDARKYRPEFNCSIVAFRAFQVKQGRRDEQPWKPLKGQEGHRDSAFLGEHSKKEDGKFLELSQAVRHVRQTSGQQLEVSAITPVKEEGAADTEVRLQPGDHIIMNAPLSFYHTWKDSSDFVVLRKVTTPEQQVDGDQGSAVIAGCILLGLIALVATQTLSLLEAVFVAIAALVVTGCTTMDFVVRAVKLRTVLTIVGAMGLGKAIGKTHVAEVLADLLIAALGSFGRQGLLVAIFAATVALGIIFHGTAVVVLMFPICNEVSKDMRVPLHQTIAVLCIAVSCQMLSPISYQTNLMAYSTGRYQFADFPKLGAGLVLCIAMVSIPTIELCFPA